MPKNGQKKLFSTGRVGESIRRKSREMETTTGNKQKLKEGDLVALNSKLNRIWTLKSGQTPKVGVVTKVFHRDVFGEFYYRVQWQLPYEFQTTEPEIFLEKKT